VAQQKRWAKEPPKIKDFDELFDGFHFFGVSSTLFVKLIQPF
jgi:hypothetical protein